MGRNYLRVRGEYGVTSRSAVCDSELPPRTRRIRIAGAGFSGGLGTTSAYAENTQVRGWQPGGCRNYLHVRGEYVLAAGLQETEAELPPRTRRIHNQHHVHETVLGTTSAYAENT